MILATIGWLLTAPALDGRAAAGYAYAHVFDPTQGKDDFAAFVVEAMAAGGWSLPRADAVTLERFLDEQKGLAVQEAAPGSPNAARDLNAVAGDILMADWGEGNEKATVAANRANGHASEFLVVQGSLGNGDFVVCRHRSRGRSQMERFFALRSRTNLAQARYKLYHVVGNDPTHGMRENAMYRDENRPGVFLQINGALFWAHDNPNVDAFGGWTKVNTFPDDTLFRRTDVPVSGTMIRELHDVKVWLVEGRVKRYVQSDGGVLRHGGWEAVRVVPDGSIDGILPREGRFIP